MTFGYPRFDQKWSNSKDAESWRTMGSMNKKDITYIFIILVLLVIGTLAFLQYTSPVTVIEEDTNQDQIPVEPDEGIGDGAEPLDEILADAPIETIGQSGDSNNIDVYRFGDGPSNVLLIGGVHGGYSWNTSQLAYELIEHYQEQESIVPELVTLHIIPALNPDGLVETLDTYENISVSTARQTTEANRIDGRFNANGVDLNRNFDCNWEATGTWRNQAVSGGSEPFSEPEAMALREYVERIDPVAAIVWFAAEGKVYPSACESNPSPASVTLAATFANETTYETDPVFDAYEITGDMVNWMAAESVPAISVLLTDFTSTEFEQNLAGVEAVLDTYAE